MLLAGSYDKENDLLSIAFAQRGGSTTSVAKASKASSIRAARIRNAMPIARRPRARMAGRLRHWIRRIDRAAIEKFVQMLIDMPIESVHTPEVHGLLIARHGKLVLEEYFHGEHRDRMHETRSAAKSLTATVIGAAMEARAPLQLSTSVYAAMNGGKMPADLDAQKRSMTLEHLLMMRSGYFCDDSNPDAPGNEDTMLDQTEEPDYYRYTLRLPLDREPAQRASTAASIRTSHSACSTGRPASRRSTCTIGSSREPLQNSVYGWPLSPAGQAYGGGGVWLLPRDFMKLGTSHAGGRQLARPPHSRRWLCEGCRLAAARPARHPVRVSLVEHRVSVQGPQSARVLRRRQRRPGRDGRARSRSGDRTRTAATTPTA